MQIFHMREEIIPALPADILTLTMRRLKMRGKS
jgi:hypothetical protein